MTAVARGVAAALVRGVAAAVDGSLEGVSVGLACTTDEEDVGDVSGDDDAEEDELPELDDPPRASFADCA